VRSPYKPDIDKYDAMLPSNYLQLLPQAVKAAFESKKFTWGNVPEWIPPKELR
jgi:nucleoporin NUP42